MMIDDIAKRGERKVEAGKKVTNTERMCMILNDGRWHSASELAEPCGFRFGSIIHNLRHLHGIEIECDGHGHGTHHYRAVM